jgi:hypothetical protein
MYNPRLSPKSAAFRKQFKQEYANDGVRSRCITKALNRLGGAQFVTEQKVAQDLPKDVQKLIINLV